MDESMRERSIRNGEKVRSVSVVGVDRSVRLPGAPALQRVGREAGLQKKLKSSLAPFRATDALRTALSQVNNIDQHSDVTLLCSSGRPPQSNEAIGYRPNPGRSESALFGIALSGRSNDAILVGASRKDARMEDLQWYSPTHPHRD